MVVEGEPGLGVKSVALTVILGLAALAVSAAPPEGSVPGTVAPGRSELRGLVERLGRSEGVDPRLVHAVIQAESGYDQFAVSRKGAMGLMQLMPETVRRLNVENPFDPEQNIRAGSREIARLINRFRGNIPLALAAYNAGEGAVARYRGIPPFDETRAYVAQIMREYTGKPFRFWDSSGPYRAPVRLTGRLEDGSALITNVKGSGSDSGAGRARLGGGFGK